MAMDLLMSGLKIHEIGVTLTPYNKRIYKSMALTGQLLPSYLDPYASYEAQVLNISSSEPSQE